MQRQLTVPKWTRLSCSFLWHYYILSPVAIILRRLDDDDDDDDDENYDDDDDDKMRQTYASYWISQEFLKVA